MLNDEIDRIHEGVEEGQKPTTADDPKAVLVAVVERDEAAKHLVSVSKARNKRVAEARKSFREALKVVSDSDKPACAEIGDIAKSLASMKAERMEAQGKEQGVKDELNNAVNRLERKSLPKELKVLLVRYDELNLAMNERSEAVAKAQKQLSLALDVIDLERALFRARLLRQQQCGEQQYCKQRIETNGRRGNGHDWERHPTHTCVIAKVRLGRSRRAAFATNVVPAFASLSPRRPQACRTAWIARSRTTSA